MLKFKGVQDIATDAPIARHLVTAEYWVWWIHVDSWIAEFVLIEEIQICDIMVHFKSSLPHL